jgi:hypothetical protein
MEFGYVKHQFKTKLADCEYAHTEHTRKSHLMQNNNPRDDSSTVSSAQEISPMTTKLQVLIPNSLLYLVNRAVRLTTLKFVNSAQCLSVDFKRFSVGTKIRDWNQIYRYWHQFRLLLCWNLNIRKFHIFWLFTERAHKSYNKSKNKFSLFYEDLVNWNPQLLKHVI